MVEGRERISQCHTCSISGVLHKTPLLLMVADARKLTVWAAINPWDGAQTESLSSSGIPHQ